MTYNDDASRIRKDHGPRNMAVLRRLIMAFETGTDRWERLATWPRAGAGTAVPATRFYLEPGLKVGMTPPEAGGTAFDA